MGQRTSATCIANKYIILLLMLMVLFGYLFMIHEFGANTSPDIDAQTNTIVISPDYINHLHQNEFNPHDKHNRQMSQINTSITKQPTNNYYLAKAIHHNKYEKYDFSFFWTSGDGSPLFINASKYDSRHEIGYKSFVFCPMPKNGCSAWKQVLRRIKGETFYLADDYWSLHSKQNNLEQDRIHTFDINGANNILYNNKIIHAVFIRDSIERCLSAFLDKCIGSHWSKKYWCKPRTNTSKISHKIYSHFDLYIDAIINKEMSLDFHWLPQNFICDLYKFVDRYNIYYSNDINSRYQFLNDINSDDNFKLKTWNNIGASGWLKKQHNNGQTHRKLLIKQKPVLIMGKNAAEQMEELDLSGSFLDKESYHSINTSLRLFQFYRADLLAKVISFYENDYILFNMSLPEWICKFVNINNVIDVRKYGEYSVYYKDYDHDVIVNESGLIWNRSYEINKRMNKYDTFIPMFYEMIDFDREYNTLIHKIRGIAILSNILTFVDVDILPLCFRNNGWDYTIMMNRERKNIIRLIRLYFNQYLGKENIDIPNEFVVKDQESNSVNFEQTFIQWRDQDKIIYHNIRNNVLFMRDIPRKQLWERFHN
eukprot:150220_1